MRDHRVFEPTRGDAQKWQTLAGLALSIANRNSRAWRDLKTAHRHAGSAMVFGQNGHDNVCNQLLEVVGSAMASGVPDAYFPEMAQLADQVLRRHKAWADVRAAADGRST